MERKLDLMRYCAKCGKALQAGAHYCDGCGAPCSKAGGPSRPGLSGTLWAVSAIFALAIAIVVGVRFGRWASLNPEPTPVPITIRELNLVSRYYSDISNHNLAAAYQLLAPALRKTRTYSGWASDYRGTVEFRASHLSYSNNAVSFGLQEQIQTAEGRLNKFSSGTWHFSHNGGKIFLDNLQIALKYSTYFSPGNPHTESIATTYGKIKQSLAFIGASTPDNIGFGTAFCIGSDESDSYFLTNSHVVPDSSAVLLISMSDSASKSPISATVMFRDDQTDAAIVQVHIPKIPVVMLEPNLPNAGQAVAIAGFPDVQIRLFFAHAGLEPSMHSGSVNALVANDSLIEFDATADHGNSGGPLFDPANGAVYGVVTYGLPSSESSAVQNNFAIPIKMLLPFITRSKVRILSAETR